MHNYLGGKEHERGVVLILDQDILKQSKDTGHSQIDFYFLVFKDCRKTLNLNMIQIFVPISTSNHEDIDKFYEDLELAKGNADNNTLLSCIMGNFNVLEGAKREEIVVGRHGLGIRNMYGKKLVEWCHKNNYIIENKWFQQATRRK